MVRTIFLTLACGALAWAPSTHAAAVDYFLKLDGIEGESTAVSHKNWIHVENVQFGVARPVATSGPMFSEIKLTLPLSKATPLLMEQCATGDPIATGRLEFLRLAGNLLLFYEVDLQEVRVQSLCASGAGADVEHDLELTCSRIEWTYTAYDVTGKQLSRTGAFWDIKKNEGGLIEKPIFRATLSTGTNGFALNWGATSGRTYRVMVSDTLEGPYAELQRYTADATGNALLPLPVEIGNRFFYLEEVQPVSQ